MDNLDIRVGKVTEVTQNVYHLMVVTLSVRQSMTA